MNTLPASSRPYCPHCLRPASACICHCVVEVDNRVDVLILQHPLEQHHAKGSGRLLHLCLRRSRLLVGDSFDLQELEAACGPMAGAWLLYPPTQPDAEGAATPAPVGALPQRLIVLDATWRKSRQLLRLNPWLLRLPRLELIEPPASRYGIRKAERDDQRSTLEATACALQQLDAGDTARYAPLWDVFDRFVELQRRARDHGMTARTAGAAFARHAAGDALAAPPARQAGAAKKA
ncbi:tRNA-uridine aminocarboxypropyltransferase [Eleftheria terrae]|uniref:tRNA-uridine aminocarboxypropyltransferase n=1 Tax=Eleftheria terrae TaxID=1597781 RepID=UPI00263AB08A|nr:tRNA-uridine aminocarboxypropyltransferase [Eleftheria terrae]WKB55518.1 DTW domain-containing protein [Eleftheria terrae]